MNNMWQSKNDLKTEIMAYIKAVLENYKELLEADLLTLTHKVKRF